jgi:ABC-type multidrug transport system fused ATPase/permease subunit
MDSFRLLFSKNNVLLSLMVVLPMLGTGLLFLFFILLPKGMPDWLIYAIIISFLVLLVCGLLYLILKKITVRCNIRITEFGVEYQLEHKNIFYRRQEFFSNWENITNIAQSSYNGQANYYRITFVDPNFTINLSPVKGKEEEAEAFFETISAHQESYNLSHQNAPIQAKNFYQGTLARILTWFFYLMTLAVILIFITDAKEIDWYRPISLFCFGSIWVANYYRNTKKLY